MYSRRVRLPLQCGGDLEYAIINTTSCKQKLIILKSELVQFENFSISVNDWEIDGTVNRVYYQQFTENTLSLSVIDSTIDTAQILNVTSGVITENSITTESDVITESSITTERNPTYGYMYTGKQCDKVYYSTYTCITMYM